MTKSSEVSIQNTPGEFQFYRLVRRTWSFQTNGCKAQCSAPFPPLDLRPPAMQLLSRCLQSVSSVARVVALKGTTSLLGCHARAVSSSVLSSLIRERNYEKQTTRRSPMSMLSTKPAEHEPFGQDQSAFRFSGFSQTNAQRSARNQPEVAYLTNYTLKGQSAGDRLLVVARIRFGSDLWIESLIDLCRGFQPPVCAPPHHTHQRIRHVEMITDGGTFSLRVVAPELPDDYLLTCMHGDTDLILSCKHCQYFNRGVRFSPARVGCAQRNKPRVPKPC